MTSMLCFSIRAYPNSSQSISREIQTRCLQKDALIQHKSRELADSSRTRAESDRFLSLQARPFF